MSSNTGSTFFGSSSSSSTSKSGGNSKGVGIAPTTPVAVDSKKAKLDPPGRDVAVTLPDGTSVHEYEAVQQYLRSCPFASPSHPAVVAAIDGVERELSKKRRDARLQAKFSSSSTGSGVASAATTGARLRSSPDPVLVNKSEAEASTGSVNMNFSSEEPDDWHQVGEEHPDVLLGTDAAAGAGGHLNAANAADAAASASSITSSVSVGSELTREVISSIALHEVRATSPVQMVALALHAALRGPLLGFACTGVPDPPPSSGAGAGGRGGGGAFASSVRELPPTQFLPKGWNADPSRVVLRYRKNGVGSMILRVEHESSLDGFDVSAISLDRVWIKVSVIPNATSLSDKDVEPSDASLTFPAGEYINLSSFQLALSASQQPSPSPSPHAGVAPALHYKGLPALLSRFVQAFDLGGIVSGASTATSSHERAELPYVDTTVRTLPAHAGTAVSSSSAAPMPTTATGPYRHPSYDESRSPTIDAAFPGAAATSARSRGDFSDDLMIGGGNVPTFGGPHPAASPWMGGNLMGPNHPLFVGRGGGGMSGVGPNSGFGMRPRFDPVGGPPGGPTDVVDPNQPGGRGGTVDPATGRPRRNLGDPNPDHLSPPNSFHSDNMFM